MYLVPSIPNTNPTKLATIINKMLNAAPKAQTWRYHQPSPYYIPDGIKNVQHVWGLSCVLPSQRVIPILPEFQEE